MTPRSTADRGDHSTTSNLPQGDGPVVKKLSLVVALVLLAGSVKADDLLNSADLNGISDANNVVVEASIDIDVDAIANKTDKSEQAIEACFRGWGGGYGGCYNYGYNYGCYNYCYTPVYYNYCYTPVYHYHVYRPVCYTTYSYCQPLYTWGCY
jgi:hypothetical protein